MGSDVVSGIDKDKTSEIAHGIQKIGFAAIVGDVARGPKIKMKNVKWTTERPREDEFAVACDSAVGSDAMGALEDPVGNIFATERPEETKTNAMKSFVDTHMAGGRGCMISRENVPTKRERNNDKHQEFFIVLDRLEDNKFAFEEGQAILANVVTVSGVEGRKVGFSKRRRRRESGEEEFGIRVLIVGRSPVKGGGDRASCRSSNKRPSDELSR
jgi:hypothetical protein